MAKELGWDEVQIQDELEKVRTFFQHRGCLKNYRPSFGTRDLVKEKRVTA